MCWASELERRNSKLLADSQIQNLFSYAYGNEEFANTFREELQYIKNNGMTPFPYETKRVLDEVYEGYENGLPYIIHNSKKLFFPQDYELSTAIYCYRNYIENENLLGGGYKSSAPHQYQSKKFYVEKGDVLLDVGCADALFALDVIDCVRKVYLIESNPQWMPALHATFKPYAEKCTIINKFVTGADSSDSISLKSILHDDGDSPVFIKMDIEGYEYETLMGSIDFLRERKNVKIACCTYHVTTQVPHP